MPDVKPDVIDFTAAATLPGLFRMRVERSPAAIAYRYFDAQAGCWHDSTWAQTAIDVARWQTALMREGLVPGDRVAILLRNCREWVLFDQAALALGLIVVPLYLDDSAENIAYILNDAGASCVLFEGTEHWRLLSSTPDALRSVRLCIALDDLSAVTRDPRLRWAAQWLPDHPDSLPAYDGPPEQLATIVYTSGTTGRCKGVMLSHRNILWNAHAALQYVPAYPDDLFLSFLPLCHTLERTIGYYLAMMAGSTVAHARSVALLGEDLLTVRPTVLISVPRIFERVYNKVQDQLQRKSPFARCLFDLAVRAGWSRFEFRQHRGPWQPLQLLLPLLRRIVAHKISAKLGGRLRVAVIGGAPLSEPLARFFIGLGLPLIQGYGLTETSPVISANPAADNDPASVGVILRDIEARIAESGELQVRGPGVMLGYWNNPAATAQLIDADGWLHTGDQVRIANNHLYITGRLKEIIVLANGKKIPPAEMELAMLLDPLFDQVMVVGEGRPFLSVLAIPNPEQWKLMCERYGIAPDASESLQERRIANEVLDRIGACTEGFPGFAQVRRVALDSTPWTAANGLLTPTLKLKRHKISELFATRIEQLYVGH